MLIASAEPATAVASRNRPRVSQSGGESILSSLNADISFEVPVNADWMTRLGLHCAGYEHCRTPAFASKTYSALCNTPGVPAVFRPQPGSKGICREGITEAETGLGHGLLGSGTVVDTDDTSEDEWVLPQSPG
ncbi:hypothetical protein [Amycolatopsis sp.]|uniref:hypothetical protein n=1 Tax=Amycolatopsis sp. TaxID=37632 RepID=UPI00262CA511|nr:hypothetical protein [Amycolatopsis sp.]